METKLCKHCQTEIPKKVKVCPNCKKKQGGILKWIIIGLLVVGLLCSVSGGDGEPSGNQDVSVNDDAANDKDITTNSDTTEDEYGWYTPEEGMKYVMVSNLMFLGL